MLLHILLFQLPQHQRAAFYYDSWILSPLHSALNKHSQPTPTHTHTHSDRESHSALTKLFHSNRIKYANITDRKKWILSRWECHQRKTYRCFFLYLFAHNIVFTGLFTCTHTRWLWINLVSVGLSKEFLIRVMIINSKWIFLSLAQPILRISHIPNYDSFVRNFLLGCVLAAIKNICRSLTGYLF